MSTPTPPFGPEISGGLMRGCKEARMSVASDRPRRPWHPETA
jgi:hypothetical protein